VKKDFDWWKLSKLQDVLERLSSSVFTAGWSSIIKINGKDQ